MSDCRRPPSKTISVIPGPTDQKRLGHVSQRDGADSEAFESVELSKPPEAPSATTGKYAATATPIRALAAAMRRSAAAISGRRSRMWDGTPTGTAGGAVVAGRGAGGREKPAGGSPVSTAMACSSSARCTPTSIAVAWVVLSWVSAWTTSTREATPARCRSCVSSSDFW